MAELPPYFERLAAAYVRGKLAAGMAGRPEQALFSERLDDLSTQEWSRLIELGADQGLRIHRFKRTMGLPRVQAVLGTLKSFRPDPSLGHRQWPGSVPVAASRCVPTVAGDGGGSTFLRCHDQPRAFPSAHARFMHFHARRTNPDYAAYDDTQFEVVLMSGMPASGKDTWAQIHRPGWPVVSLDRIREETNASPDDAPGTVVQLARERARQFLRARTSFVWNATNLTRRLRSSLVSLFTDYGARVRIVYVEAPWDTILARNRVRLAKVPERVLDAMVSRLEVPTCEEAHLVEWQT